MSDYHVLETADKEHQARVVFHVPIPDANNAAGVNWQMALRQYQPFTEDDSVVPNHKTDFATESANMVSGAIYEHVETVYFAATMTNGEKQTVIETRFSQLETTVPARLQKILKFWGLNNDVA